MDKNTDIVSTFGVTESTWREEAKKLAWNLQDIPNDKLALLTLQYDKKFCVTLLAGTFLGLKQILHVQYMDVVKSQQILMLGVKYTYCLWVQNCDFGPIHRNIKTSVPAKKKKKKNYLK